jgi:beta-glucanase (GH16 family)
MKRIIVLSLLATSIACSNPQVAENTSTTVSVEESKDQSPNEVKNFVNSSRKMATNDSLTMKAGEWLDYDIHISEAGRYKVSFSAKADSSARIWLEDYIHNTDDRSYNISGDLAFSNGQASVMGSPLDSGMHQMRLHFKKGEVTLESMDFKLIKKHQNTPISLTQKMDGDNWELVWSDEFDGQGLPDTTKWSYNIGDWGWGNNEPQYYTESKLKNARQEDGNLIIEAHKNDDGNAWSSARLSTQGKQSFLYGKIEFRAKVPVGRGTWAAGWLLGNAYRDEISWPYCGEIDVLECVGYEIDDSTGNGINHATCHTRAFYFKQGNQIGNEIAVNNMDSEFHTYAVEWYPDVIYGLLDGERYFTYDKNADDLEWPFFNPQNIILNLAVGGGWGGAKGIDPQWENHQYILDYVRVYELR